MDITRRRLFAVCLFGEQSHGMDESDGWEGESFMHVIGPVLGHAPWGYALRIELRV